MQGTIGEVLRLERSIKPDAHAVGTINGVDIDISGFSEVGFILDVGTVAGGGTVDGKVQEAADDGSGSPGAYADVPGTNTVQIVASDKSAVVSLNAEKRKKFVRFVATVGTATTDLGVTAVTSRSKYPPIVQVADEVLIVE